MLKVFTYIMLKNCRYKKPLGHQLCEPNPHHVRNEGSLYDSHPTLAALVSLAAVVACRRFGLEEPGQGPYCSASVQVVRSNGSPTFCQVHPRRPESRHTWKNTTQAWSEMAER